MTFLLRPAAVDDGPFLAEMLAAAVFWRPGGPAGDVSYVLAHPQLAHYVDGWPQPGDMGVVAEAARPVGAAWLRFLPGSDPGYGFVDATTPEMSMGVAAPWRGRGIGSGLLDALIAQARQAGLPALCLSVEDDNPARRLYERAGFLPFDDTGGALTMLLQL